MNKPISLIVLFGISLSLEKGTFTHTLISLTPSPTPPPPSSAAYHLSSSSFFYFDLENKDHFNW